MSSEENVSKRRKGNNQNIPEMPEQLPPVTPPQVSEEQKQFLDALNNLIFTVQELAYAKALVKEDIVDKYPELKDLMASATEVIRSAYQFHKLVKQGVGKT